MQVGRCQTVPNLRRLRVVGWIVELQRWRQQLSLSQCRCCSPVNRPSTNIVPPATGRSEQTVVG